MLLFLDGLPTVTDDAKPSQQQPIKRNTVEDASHNSDTFHKIQSTAIPTKKNKDAPTRHESKLRKHDHPAWLVYTSAVPTVCIFIICLIIIAVKYRNEDE